jgi:hypothetical protein
MMQI